MALRWYCRGFHRRIQEVRFVVGRIPPFFCPIPSLFRRRLGRSLFRLFFVRGCSSSSFCLFPCFWWFFHWKRKTWWVMWGGRQVSWFWILFDMGFERGEVVVRVILVLWVSWVGRRGRVTWGGIDVPHGGVGIGGNGDIGRNDSLSSNVPIGSSWCRRFFCDVFLG